jgi:predicted TIM-barrel fold metal-dependent hydrolase
MTQNDLLGQILTSGLCERFPDLKLVNVETGFGHVPFYLESLNWHWRTYGNEAAAGKGSLLPSEYFARQCYGTYWFETSQLRDLDLYPDNFMFSTDFPHGTSLAPGPCAGTTLTPAEYVKIGHTDLDPVLREKALSGNAAAVYKLELPARVTAGA